jgi:hypothetical protein
MLWAQFKIKDSQERNVLIRKEAAFTLTISPSFNSYGKIMFDLRVLFSPQITSKELFRIYKSDRILKRSRSSLEIRLLGIELCRNNEDCRCFWVSYFHLQSQELLSWFERGNSRFYRHVGGFNFDSLRSSKYSTLDNASFEVSLFQSMRNSSWSVTYIITQLT